MDTTRLLRPLRVDPADDATADRLYASFTAYAERLAKRPALQRAEAINAKVTGELGLAK